MIKKWDEIQQSSEWKNEKNSLLLGNGFSINIHHGFQYNSLLDNIDKNKGLMYPHARDIFNKLDTSNFEEILRVVYHAYLVNFYNLDAIKTLYLNIRKALIESVKLSHVAHSDVPRIEIEKEFSKYSSIFTTNYDLITYWSINFYKYCDFFWEGTFNVFNTDVWPGKIPIYYLHGAIHLKINKDGKTIKVSANKNQSIQEVIKINFGNDTPLFISEGKYQMKERRILENDYLSFCFNKLRNIEDRIVIFGHSLSDEYDKHILDALKNGKSTCIAISVFSKLSMTEKNVFVSKINNHFSGANKKLYFFESSSHPLALPNIKSVL